VLIIVIITRMSYIWDVTAICVSVQVNLKDMQVESTREVLGRSTEDRRAVQQALSTATEQNIAHLETITQLQDALSEKDKMLESKNE